MKSALARAGSMSKLRGPRSLSYSEGSPQKQTPKSVKFDKTDEVIHYDVMTPELTEEYWEQISLQSCDSDLADRGDSDGRPLPAVPQFVIPSTLLRNEPSSPLQSRRTLMASPIADDDEFDFNLHQKTVESPELTDIDNVELPEPLNSPQLPEPVLNAPSMSTRIDAIMASGSGMSPSLRGSSGHRRTDSQMSEMSEASAPYLPLRSPQRHKPEEDEDDPAKWRDVSSASVARQDSLQDSQRHPPTKKVSESKLPPPVDLDRTYSKRRKELATMLDPRTVSTAHAVLTIPEEAEESEIASPEPETNETVRAENDTKDHVSAPTQHVSPLQQHEIAPLLSEESQFIHSQPSIPQSSSEVLQTDFDFGDDSYWNGGYLKNLREDTREEHSHDGEDTANATIGISGEPAAQFAAGMSPALPDYSDDDERYEVRDESRPEKISLDEVENDEGVLESNVCHDEFESGGIAREHSYLNIKDLRAEDLDVGPTLAPVHSESDFFSVPVSPERHEAPINDMGMTKGPMFSNTDLDDDNLSSNQQSTPQKQNDHATEELTLRNNAYNPAQKRDPISEESITSEQLPVDTISSETHRDLPETPAKAKANVPPVRVLPWDPSIENFQTSPIPVPDRSPKRQQSPQRPETADREASISDDALKSVHPMIDQSASDHVAHNADAGEAVDTGLQELTHSSSTRSSVLQISEEQGSMISLSNADWSSPEDANGSISEPSDNPLNASIDVSPRNLDDDSHNDLGTADRVTKIPTMVPALSPVTFSPFIASIPSSPIESSLKEPDAPVPAVGIDEIVASPTINHAESLASPSNPRSELSPDVKAKSPESDDSDASVSRGQPHLDSDLSDFEESPELQTQPTDRALSRRSIDDLSTWESVSSHSRPESRLSNSSQQLSLSSSIAQQVSPKPSTSLSSDRPTHAARPSVTDEVSLREPSFGESMSSTLQQMLSQRSDFGSDAIERSYTLRESGSYVVATSPVRRQRRSQALEIIRDEDGSSYSMQQIAIPRNRPLPTHSSVDQSQLNRAIEGTGQHDNMRAPSVISRTDSSSYSLTVPSTSSQSHPFITTRGTNAVRLASETKLGPIFEPANDSIEQQSSDTGVAGPAHGDRNLHPIIEPSMTESEDSMIAASSSKTGREIRMLDHSLLQEDKARNDMFADTALTNTTANETQFATSTQYQPTIFPNGVLFLVVKCINMREQLPQDTLVTLTLDNGVHCVTSAPRGLSEIDEFGEEYRIGVLEVPLSLTIRLCSPSGPIQVPELELGADGSFAKLETGDLRKDVFGKRRELTLRGVNEWASLGKKTVCNVDVSAMYIPCVSHRERLPGRLSDAAERIDEARALLRERQARMQGVLRQYGGDVARHRGKQRWFVLDPVAPLLVAHSLRTHKARTLINLAKATSAAQVDSHKLEVRFRNGEILTFQVQSTLELATWLRALRGCIGNDQVPRPKWIDAVIYESENGQISA